MRSAHKPSSSIERFLVLVLVGFIAVDLLLIVPAFASELRLDRIHPSLPVVSLCPLADGRARIAEELGEEFAEPVQQMAGELRKAGAKAFNAVLFEVNTTSEDGQGNSEAAFPLAPSATPTVGSIETSVVQTATPLALPKKTKIPPPTKTPGPSYTQTSTSVPTEQMPSVTPTQKIVATATLICAIGTPRCQTEPAPSFTPTDAPSQTQAPTHTPLPTTAPTNISFPTPVLTYSGNVPAFPGAEGWGAESVGGRGGQVIEVTNLNDSGPGSLRAALEAAGPRTVVFRVGGLIHLLTSIDIRNSFITIAGQTAPGSGIILQGAPITIRTNDVIIRYLTYRGTGKIRDYAFFIVRSFDATGAHDIIVDHCSGNWANNDLISINQNSPGDPDIHHVTVQNCVFGYPNPEHPTTLLITNNSGIDNVNYVSINNNLFSTSGHRNPNVQGVTNVEVINNVVYNFRHRVGEFTVSPGDDGAAEVDYINNYLYRGPASGDRFIRWEDLPDSRNDPNEPLASVYISGNIAPVAGGLLSSPLMDPRADNWDFITYYEDDTVISTLHRRTSRLAQPPFTVSVSSASDAYEQVLDSAGNYRGLNADGSWSVRRNVIDQRLISEVRNNSGPNDYSDVDFPGDIGPLDPGSPYADTDHDGMADQWEINYCLDPENPDDGSQDSDGDGFTNLEEFLNGTQPRGSGGC